jgi:S-adenosylmethionine uptake transporter
MAEAMAISFIAPLIALYLAAVMLKEKIRASAVIASLLGIAGVVVIAAGRLGGGSADSASAWGIAAILGSAVFYAWNLILQRQQALLAKPIEVALFQNVFVAAFFLPFAPWFLAWPDPGALRDIAAGAGLAAVSLMLLSWGYARAEAQALVPIEYTGFVWAALFGWLWFDEAVTAATIAGTVLIVTGCWIAMRQPARRRIPPAPMAPGP